MTMQGRILFSARLHFQSSPFPKKTLKFRRCFLFFLLPPNLKVISLFITPLIILILIPILILILTLITQMSRRPTSHW